MNLCEQVLQTIKDKQIKPEQKWKLYVKHGLVWLGLLISIVIGAISTAVIIFAVKNEDWGLYQHWKSKPFQFILLSIPYIWIILMIGFLFLAYLNFRKTKKGYKYNFYVIFAGSLISSFVLGVVLHNIQSGEKIDNFLAERIPAYNDVRDLKEQRWVKPEEGILAGQVLEIDQEYLKIGDLRGMEWKIIGNIEDPNLRPMIRVRIVGQRVSPGIFEADKIVPFEQRIMLREIRRTIQIGRPLPPLPDF